MQEAECPKCGREYSTFPRMGSAGMFDCPYCRREVYEEARKKALAEKSKKITADPSPESDKPR